MKTIKIDADLENSDWTKQSYDLPTGKELEAFLKLNNMTMDDFKKLPAYYLPRETQIRRIEIMSIEKTYLDVPFEMKDEEIEESGLFHGYGSTFGGAPDSYRDVVMPGAFRKTIEKGGRNGTGVAMLYQHDSRDPIGIWKELVEDKKGLRVTGQLIREVPSGDKAYHLLKKKAIRGLSIGYDTVLFEKDEKENIRFLKEVDLWEISLVTFPANTYASVTGIKQRLQQAKTERELENALRESGQFSKSDAQHIISLCKNALRDSRTEGVSEAGLSAILDSLREVNLNIIQPRNGLTGILNSLQQINS